jgi:hypothetical protein
VARFVSAALWLAEAHLKGMAHHYHVKSFCLAARSLRPGDNHPALERALVTLEVVYMGDGSEELAALDHVVEAGLVP